MCSTTWIHELVRVLALVVSGSALAADRDACSLLTAAEVSNVLGVTFRNGVHIASSSTTVCGWSVSDPPRADEPKVVVAVKTPEAFERGKTPVGGKVVKTPVTGLGDEAYSSVVGGHDATLVVRKGSAAFDVTLRGSGSPVDQVLQKEKELAERVLARL